jgi:glucose-1-phosphate thymidylyltransferase
MKGIVLAGGTGSRLWPITRSISKQLLPVYDKPMIYYPISTLMLAGIREILIITTPQDREDFIALLGHGEKFGIKIVYAIQETPKGLAQALIIAEKFLAGETSMLILGDNIFHGVGLGRQLEKLVGSEGCNIFTFEVADPSQYGILNVDVNGKPISVVEKPLAPTSRLAITGLYVFDKEGPSIALEVKPSKRGELEIISVIEKYLMNSALKVNQLSRGTVWLDTGTPSAMNDASNYIRLVEDRSGYKIGCLEEIALNKGWITRNNLKAQLFDGKSNDYYNYLHNLIND